MKLGGGALKLLRADTELRPCRPRGAAKLSPRNPRERPTNLVCGLTGGTFYIRARNRAGACVPAVSETLVHWTGYGWLRSWARGLLFFRDRKVVDS